MLENENQFQSFHFSFKLLAYVNTVELSVSSFTLYVFDQN